METNRNNGPKGIGLKDAEGNVIGHPLNRQDSKSLAPNGTTGISFPNNNIDKTINENMPFLFKNPPLLSVPSIDCCLNGDYKILPNKKDYRERYKKIAESEWFKKTHENMSVGEIIEIEE